MGEQFIEYVACYTKMDEIQAMNTIVEVLEPLDSKARLRVLRWTLDRYMAQDVASALKSSDKAMHGPRDPLFEDELGRPLEE